MTVYLAVEPAFVHVMARLEGPGGVLGDLSRTLGPGDSLLGYSYEELRALGTGRHELEPRDGETP